MARKKVTDQSIPVEETPLPDMTAKEVKKQPPPVPEFDPNFSINDVINDIRGFGLEDTEDLVTLDVGNKKVYIRLSNIPNEWEAQVLYAAEGLKGHAWVTRVKCEMLSKSISWINGVSLKDDASIFVTNPATGQEGNIRPVLRDILMGWGQEVINVLWKVFMVHCQKIEDRLVESMPESAVVTDIEKRFFEKAMEELAMVNREVLKDSVKSILMGEEGTT